MFLLASTLVGDGNCQSEGPVNPTIPQSEHQFIGEAREEPESSMERDTQDDAVEPIDCAPVATIMIDLTNLSQGHQLDIGVSDGK